MLSLIPPQGEPMPWWDQLESGSWWGLHCSACPRCCLDPSSSLLQPHAHRHGLGTNERILCFWCISYHCTPDLWLLSKTEPSISQGGRPHCSPWSWLCHVFVFLDQLIAIWQWQTFILRLPNYRLTAQIFSRLSALSTIHRYMVCSDLEKLPLPSPNPYTFIRQFGHWMWLLPKR